MKALILKEMRENLKIAVIGLLLTVLVVIGSQLHYLDLARNLVKDYTSANNFRDRFQPLTSSDFQIFSVLSCALAGAMLGWFQIQSERHRDLWAFLVHRPVTRTTIFLAKVIVGLSFYAAVAGVPLAWFVWWDKTPGHVAAPFAWGMAWHTLAGFMAGAVTYFAAMLTSVRQARWYGSRTFGLGLAIVTTIVSQIELRWWFAALFILTSMVILAVANWGAFHNGGRFAGQPAAGKVALTLSLAMGAGLAAVMGLLVMTMFFLNGNSQPYTYYAMGKDGNIYKMTVNGGEVPVADLSGRPLMDPKTGKLMDVRTFFKDLGLGGISAGFSQGVPRSQRGWFNLLCGTRDTVWYNMIGSRRIEGYDLRTRRFIGSIGPDGFSTDARGDGRGFMPSDVWRYGWGFDSLPPVASTNAIYDLDLEKRAVNRLWVTDKDETIEACGNTYGGGNTLVMTRKNIRLLNQDGSLIWTAPFTNSNYYHTTVTLYGYTNDTGPMYSVWISSRILQSDGSTTALPTQVMWLTKSGENTHTQMLPLIKPPQYPNQLEKILGAAMPPFLPLAVPLFADPDNNRKIDWKLEKTSLFVSVLVCIPVGIWLGRRYSFSGRRMAVWAVFHLICGLPGLLAFISVQEWPAREICPGCDKLRVVNNENCEHCQTTFAPPAKNGTEVFEPLEIVRG